MSSQTPTPLQGGPSSSLQGWNHLTKAVAQSVPTSLKRAHLIRRAAMRELARIPGRR